jgi:hypothetical protein
MTEELQNVTKAFDDLNEKQKIINDLQVGTEEWTKAVQENNQAILQLLSDYAELSAYIVTDENGVMSVSAEGEEILEDKLQTQTNRAYAQTLYQQSEVFKADNKVKDLVAGEKISSDNDDIDYAASSGGLKEAFAEAEEQAIRKRASELYSQNYDENNGLDSEGLKEDLIQEFGEEAAKVFFDDYGDYEGSYNDYIEDDIRTLAGTDYSDDFYYDLQEILQGSATKEGLAEEIAKTFDMEAAASEELANALWEEKDAIYDNVASINTNTDAVERLEAAYAAQFFANNESRLEAESTAAWDALMGDQITKEAEKATGKATDSNDSGKEKDDLNDEAMKNYAASLGVTEDQLEIKDGKVKVKGADDSTAVNLDDAAELANQYAGAVEAEKQSEKITKLVNTAYAAADEVGAGSLINLSGGQRSVALDSSTTTLDDIENLDASKEAIFESLMATGDYANRDEVAQALGYENEASYNAAFQRTKLSAESSVKKLTAGHLNGGAFDASKYGSATMDQAKTIADAFETVFQSAGNKGTEALNAMLDDFSGDPDTQEKIAQIASSIDFTDINAENKFKAALEEANIYVDETSEGWKTMVDSMAEAANVAGSVAHQFSAIRGDLAEIKSLTDGLKFGDVVSDEDYKNLIKFNSAAKDMFIQTADGYEFIGGNGKQLKELLTEGYSDLNNVRNDFNLISDAATNFAGKEDSIKVHNSTAENQKVANDIIATKGYEQLLAAQGVNADNFVNALAIVNDPNADKGSEEYKNAIAVMESGISAVSQSLTDNEAGLFSGDQAVETWVSYNADSWSEAKGMLGDQGYGEDSELYKKFETKWKNTFLSELGFSGSAVSMLGADELESHLRTVRQLELDYYQDINAELNLLGASIDRAFGADRLEMLQKQVDLQKESQAIAYDQYADMQQTFTAISTDFLANAATNYGVNASELTNEDGTLDLAALRDLQLNYSTDSAEYEDIENLITMWSQLDDAAVSAAEAAWGVVDAQVESFRYQNEMQAKLRDTQKQWLEFGQKFAGYGEKGLNVFGEQSAADMINTAFENYAASREVLTEDIFTSLSGMNEIADRVTNLSDEYNAAAEITAAKQAGLDTARSDFSTATDLMATIEEERAKYQVAANAEKAVAAAEKRLANAESAIVTAEQNKTTADADVVAAQEVVEAAKGAVAEKTAKVATAQAEADDAGKKTRDAKQAALATAQNEEAAAKKELETAQAQLANATAAASHAQATLTAAQTAKENAQSELDSVKEANGGKTSAELEQDKQNALKAYADSLRAMGVTVAESGYTFESLSAAYEEAVGKVAEAADRVEGAQQEVLAAQAAQKSIAEEIAANNPYATVGADGTLIWDANAFSEDWEDFLTSGQDTLEDMQSQLQSLYDGYIQAQGELMAIYDEEISKLGTINSILQSSAELWKLVGKNATNFSSKLTSYYQSVVTNSEKSYQLASVQLEVAQSEYDKVMALGTEASDEMIKTVTDNLATASENVVSSATEWMTAISESFSASMNAAIDDFVKQATGMDLTGITESWELATAKEERYLDDVNAGYEIDNVERTFQKSIDATDSITAQKKLNSVMQEQLKMLREKDKLSQYDIDRANAMYELTLKQIALEEAQQTANKMKLSRDASGNYTYQYVADQDSIAKAEEELAAAENNLYNMDKERNQTLVDDYYSTMTEANEAIAEAMAEGDTERVARLKEYYFGADGLLSGIQSELRAAQINLNAIGTDLMGGGWTSSLESFTSAIVDSDLGALAETVGGIVDETSTTLEGVTTTITSMLSEGSFLSESVNALNNSLKSAGELEAETRELMVATHNVLTELPILTTEIDSLVAQLESYGEKYQEWLESKIDETETAANTLATESNTEALRDLTNVIKGESNSSDGEGSTGGTSGSGFSQVGGTGVNRNTVSTRTDV